MAVPLAISAPASSAPTVKEAAAAPAVAAKGTLRLARTMDRTLRPYYPTSGTNEAFSTPAVGDVSGDRVPEIVVAGNDGTVVAYRSDGSTRWSSHVANAAILASPVLADVGGDGIRDVVVGAMDGSVVWLDGPTGRIVHRYLDTPSLACLPGVYCKPRGFFATPAVADLDGDGAPEIVAASWDHQLYAWHRSGSTYFRRFLVDTLWSSPVVADIDNNGSKEIVLGGDRYPDATHPQGGYLWVLRNNGTDYPGYPKLLPGQTIWSSPALADLNGDHHLDITVGTGTNFPDPAGHVVYAFTAATGRALPGWPVSTPGRVVSSPAVADLDGDGRADVVVGTEGGYVEAFSGTGRRMWAVCDAISSASCQPGYATHGGATIADIDHDGRLDVVSALDKHIRVYRASDGALERQYLLGSDSFAGPSSATIAEVGGKTWIVQNTIMERSGVAGRNSGDLSRTWVFTTDTPLGAAPWPTFHRDAARTGLSRVGTETWFPLGTATAFVQQQYRDFLGRAADGPGLAFWTKQLSGGGSVGSTMIVRFLGSAEFGRALAPVVRVHLGLFGTPPTNMATLSAELAGAQKGTTSATLANSLIAATPSLRAKTNTRVILDAYGWAWGHAPTAAQISSGLVALLHGTTRGQLVASITDSAWASGWLGSRVNVTMTYAGMLRRVPDSPGYRFWVHAISTGRSTTGLAGLFQFSNEYYNRFH